MHALSGADDVNREFESQLTQIVGIVSSKALQLETMFIDLEDKTAASVVEEHRKKIKLIRLHAC